MATNRNEIQGLYLRGRSALFQKFVFEEFEGFLGKHIKQLEMQACIWIGPRTRSTRGDGAQDAEDESINREENGIGTSTWRTTLCYQRGLRSSGQRGVE